MKIKLQNSILIIVTFIFALHVQGQNKLPGSKDIQKIKPQKENQKNIFQKHSSTMYAQGSSVPNKNRGGINDDCSTAYLLTEDSVCNPVLGDVVEATQSMSPGTCNTFTSGTAYDVWYKFVAVTTNPEISVTGSLYFDAAIFLFDSCGGSVLGCSDATENAATETIFSSGLTIGNTYYIRVYDYGDSLTTTTTFDICVYSAPPLPTNDDCVNAILLNEQSSCNPVGGYIDWSTESMSPGTCNGYTSGQGNDVWYKFVATTPDPFIDVTGSSFFDAVVFLFDGCGGSILDCADASINGETETIASSGLTPGNSYYIRVYGFGDAIPTTTTFDICVYAAPVGIDEINKSLVPSLFPNPASGIFNIRLGSVSEKTTIGIYDVLGTLVEEKIILNSKGTMMNTSSLADGVYSVKVQNENGTFTQKIILNK